jgi:hypothetical protein
LNKLVDINNSHDYEILACRVDVGRWRGDGNKYSAFSPLFASDCPYSDYNTTKGRVCIFADKSFTANKDI